MLFLQLLDPIYSRDNLFISLSHSLAGRIYSPLLAIALPITSLISIATGPLHILLLRLNQLQACIIYGPLAAIALPITRLISIATGS